MIFFAIVFLLISAFSPISVSAFEEKTTIVMNDNGFEPKDITIQKDTTVVFVNNDSKDRWPASNIHPTHGIYPEFDPQKPVASGKSWQFVFDKAGVWKFHDHILPHMKGTITVEGKTDKQQTSQGFMPRLSKFLNNIKQTILHLFNNSNIEAQESNAAIPSEQFLALTQKEQIAILDSMIGFSGVEAAWKYVVDVYTNSTSSSGNAHDLAHFVGGRIYEKNGISGLSICTASFAFGCYHGFTESALEKLKAQNAKFKIDETLQELANACESVGEVGSGPWASCIHGIGHGIGTYFDTVDLTSALLACEQLINGQTYCYDGVFMEFAVNAPKSVYEKTFSDPLYPCIDIAEKYRQACSRQQPTVMKKFLGMTTQDIVNTCLASSHKTIRSSCIDALGLSVGQESSGDPKRITDGCSIIKETEAYAQCVTAAAGEIVFQKYKDSQQNAFSACDTLPNAERFACTKRVKNIIEDYN